MWSDSEGVKRICILAMVAYCYLFWLPIAIYNAYRLWKQRSANSFQARHAIHVLFWYFIWIIHAFIDLPLTLLFLYTNHETTGTLTFIVHGAHDLEVVAFILVFLSRCWLLYYDYRLNDTTANLSWRLEIDSGYTQRNWWLLKRHSWGNPTYCAVFFVLVWVLCLAVYSACYKYLDENVAAFVIFTAFTLPIVGAFTTILVKIRSVTDGFNIKRELVLCFRLLFICFILYLSVIFVAALTDVNFNGGTWTLLTGFLTVTTAGIIGYFNAYFIVVKPYRRDELDESLLEEIPELVLDEILSTRTGFESFMKHLVGEFSVENLLFVAEVQQYRGTMGYTRGETEQLVVPEIDLSWLPLAAPLCQEDALLRATYIYCKYIHKTAPHQINISGSVNTKLKIFFPSVAETDFTVHRMGSFTPSLLRKSVASFGSQKGNNRKVRFVSAATRREKEKSRREKNKSLPTPKTVRSRVFSRGMRSKIMSSMSKGSSKSSKSRHNVSRSTSRNAAASSLLKDRASTTTTQAATQAAIASSHGTRHALENITQSDIPDLAEALQGKPLPLSPMDLAPPSPTGHTVQSSDGITEIELSASSRPTLRNISEPSDNRRSTSSGDSFDDQSIPDVPDQKHEINVSQLEEEEGEEEEEEELSLVINQSLVVPKTSQGTECTVEDSRFLTTSLDMRGDTYRTNTVDTDPGSPFDGSIRGTVLHVSESEQAQRYELYHLFDTAEREIWRLMNDSLLRFQQTNTYEYLAIQNAYKTRLKNGQKHLSTFWKELRQAVSFGSLSGAVLKSSDFREPLLSHGGSIQ